MVALALIVGRPACVLAQEPAIKVHLLGTGAPIPRVDRYGPSTLVEAGGLRLLFDAGRGVSQRLWQLRMSLGSIDAVFLTHLHSDHLVGLPDLWLTGWLQPEYGQRKKALGLYGPAGTALLASSLRQGFSADIDYRHGKENLPLDGIDFKVVEIESEQFRFAQNGVTVSPIEVDHGTVKPAYGYKVEFQGKTVVLSGDTRFNENLMRQSKSVDLLVHEIVSAPSELRQTGFVQRQYGYHTSPPDLARLLEDARPGLAVLSHFVLLGNAAHTPPTADDVVREIRQSGYGGPLVAGVDLMRFDIGAAVTVVPPPAR